MIDDDLLLFIEPENEPSKLPIIDDITKKIAKALRRGIPGAQTEKWTEDGNVRWKQSEPPHMIIEMPWNETYNFTTHTGWMGVHQCSCGVYSHACNYLLPSGEVVNSLCIHYVAFHRDEIPQEQLDRISNMPLYSSETIEPTDEELNWSPRKNEERVPMSREEYLEKYFS